MNAPTPGWHPDPTGRHEYRYWDGATWTQDVSDNGVTAVDPVAPAGGPGADPTAPVDQTQHADPTQQYAQQPGVPPQPQPAGFGAPPPGYDPYSSGQLPPAQPVRSGPSTGLIVGLAAVAVALIAGLVFLLSSDDENADDPDTDAISDQSVTDDSSADDTSSGDALDDALDDIGDIGSGDGIVELIAAGMEMEADGAITHDQAVCAAQAMVDHFGLEDLMDMSTSGDDPFADATIEDQTAIIDMMTECIPIEVLMELGMSSEGG